LYKAFLFVLAVFLIVLMFPMQGKFKYEFQRGKPWRHADLIAPFDFAIFKTTQEVRLEKEKVLKDFKPYFTYNDTVRQENRQMLIIDFENLWQNNYPDKLNDKKKNANLNFCLEIYDSIYNKGIIRLNDDIKNKPGDYFINLVKNKVFIPYSLLLYIYRKSSAIIL
jgi:hypothetical protein